MGVQCRDLSVCHGQCSQSKKGESIEDQCRQSKKYNGGHRNSIHHYCRQTGNQEREGGTEECVDAMVDAPSFFPRSGVTNTPRAGVVNCAQVEFLGLPFRNQRTLDAPPPRWGWVYWLKLLCVTMQHHSVFLLLLFPPVPQHENRSAATIAARTE